MSGIAPRPMLGRSVMVASLVAGILESRRLSGRFLSGPIVIRRGKTSQGRSLKQKGRLIGKKAEHGLERLLGRFLLDIMSGGSGHGARDIGCVFRPDLFG